MGTKLRFAFLNRVESAVLKNGTGGGSPIRDEVSPWVMENAQNRDRGHVWQQASGTGTYHVDYDLTGGATDVSVGLLAALGQRGAPDTAPGITSIVTRYSTHANGYPPDAASSWTDFPSGTLTLGLGVRDAAAVVTPVSCRYIRWSITCSGAFTLGRLFAGTIEVDLGIVSSPGYLRRRVIPMSENRMGGNLPFTTQVGDPFYEFSLPYRSMKAADHAKLLQIGSQARPFVMIDHDDAPREVKLRDHTFAASLLWNQPEVYDASLELESLG